MADAAATVAGAELRWSESGTGRAVVWAHGLGLNARTQEDAGIFDWQPVAAAGRRLIRYDARGHGQSSGTHDAESYTWPRLAADLLELCVQVAPGEVVSGIGSSMGTATLIYAALAEPLRFDRLVLTSPGTAWERRASRIAGYLDASEAGSARFEALLATSPRSPAFPSGAPHPLPLDVDDSLLPAILRGAARSDLPPREALAGIDCPVLVLAWTGDTAHPVEVAQELARTIPRADLHVAGSPCELARWPGTVAAFLSG